MSTDTDSEEIEAPSQMDIWEGICLSEHGDIVRAIYERKEIARGETREEVFAALNRQAETLCCPRIFTVNDHGNVTEYAYDSTVIGSWV